VDVRQRLAVSTGYGVAELQVHAGSEMVGQPLRDSGLSDRDITVLTLHRGTSVIPSPHPSKVLEAEDRLLCFGKLEEMRSMIPERPRRRRKVKRLTRTAITAAENPPPPGG
jgi:ribosomal protein S6--L-glutamate ligase